MIQKKFIVFTASSFLFLIVFFAPSLIASQENSNKPSFNRSIPQSEIQHPQLKMSEVIQKTKKLQNGLVSYRKGEGYEK